MCNSRQCSYRDCRVGTGAKTKLTFLPLADVCCVHQTVKAFLPDMISGNRGHIVTMSSAGGLVGVSGLSDYGASKAAALGFHEAVRMELYALNKTGVHTTLVCPFFINTGMFAGVKTRYLTCCAFSSIALQ